MTRDSEIPRPPHELFLWLSRLLCDRYAAGEDTRTKICVILGAGCSVWSGLRLWDRAFKQELITESSKLFKLKTTFVDECWRELSGIVGLPGNDADRTKQLIERASIEDIASVALKYGVISDDVYRLLRERFTPADTKQSGGLQPPQLAYELLAHFLKHGFIDHVLTFNFDELLDEAIANELGAGEFVTVATDHDIGPLPAAQLPHLVKLHGTLGRPETLRFTRTATSSFPPSMTRLLDEIVFDLDPETGRRKRGARQTYLISLGYGWRDPDLRHWVRARHRCLEGLVVFSRSGELDVLSSVLPESRSHYRGSVVRELDISQLCDVPKDSLSVDIVLSALWKELESLMLNDLVPFMPASRHLLLGYLFGPHPDKPAELNNTHNALKRFVVEFVLHLTKCKGMVNLSTMSASDRISRYYAPVCKEYSEQAQGTDSDLIGLVTSPTFIASLRYGTKATERSVKQAEYPDVKETYYATAREPEELTKPLLSTNRFYLDVMHRPVYSHDRRKIVVDSDVGSVHAGEAFVRDLIVAIFNGPEIEVGRRIGGRSSWSLPSAQPIPTFIDLRNRTTAVLKCEWTDLFVIAETGAWLVDPEVKKVLLSKQERSILMIEAEQPGQEEWPLRTRISVDLSETWKAYADQGVNVSSIPLSWWQHNRHLTLAFQRKARGRLVCHGGIYFRRRHKASRIQPMFVNPTNSEDVAELMLTFLSYLRRGLEELRQAAASAVDGKTRPTSSPKILDASAASKVLNLRDRACDVALLLKPPQAVKRRLDRLLVELRRTTFEELVGHSMADLSGLGTNDGGSRGPLP